MLKYVLAFIAVMFITSMFLYPPYPPGKIPAGFAGVQPTSAGVWKKREGLITEIKVVDSNRNMRFVTDVNNKNENNDADSPHFGI